MVAELTDLRAEGSVTELRHVRKSLDKRTAEEIDTRAVCTEFETFTPLFEKDPTFLMADVEVVATYRLFNINRVKLENIIHRVFGPAQMDIETQDRFGNPVKPREWFLVPHFVADEAVERIKDGTIPEFVYAPATARLVPSRS